MDGTLTCADLRFFIFFKGQIKIDAGGCLNSNIFIDKLYLTRNSMKRHKNIIEVITVEKSEIKSNWDKMAKAYEDFTGGEDSYSNLIEWKTIKTIIPNLKDKRVLDLGCGTGRFSFMFEKLGPKQIVGIDISDSMLEIGRKYAKEKNSIVKFIKNDIENMKDISSNSFDFIFSSTTLHYLKTLDNIMKEIERILVPGGTCILSVIHPVYTSYYPVENNSGSFPKDEEWKVNYLDKSIRAYIQPWIEYNPEIDNYLSYSYHHTMSDYINNIVKSGLQIEELLEPMPPDEWKDNNIGRYYGYIETPVYAIFKLNKKD